MRRKTATAPGRRQTTKVLRAPALALVLCLSISGVAAETITVSAAASLTDAFKEIAQTYASQHPDDTVQLNFASSGTLLQQIANGAPVDVFASADEHTMDKAEAANLVAPGSRLTFVKNTLVLIQPASASASASADAGIASLAALRAANIERIAVGNPNSVPVGRYTKLALEAAGEWNALQGKIVQTQNVRQALDYVARGEVNAGFVYGSDAALMKNKVKIVYTVAMEKPVTYPIALIRQGSKKVAASRFLELVVSPTGQNILARYGFAPAAGK